jgi:LemA protein
VKSPLTAALAIAAAVASASEFVHVRNRLVLERNAVNASWLEVDQALDRRAELIPGLEQYLHFLAASAGGLFDDLASARADVAGDRSPTEKFAANERLSSALSRLLVLTESYSKLRSDRKFLSLEEELEGTENRIAIERRKYNETLEHYNSSIQVFPENVVAALSGFARNDNYFHTASGTRARPGLTKPRP